MSAPLVSSFFVPIAPLTLGQYEALTAAFADVKSKSQGDVKSFYKPRPAVKLPFLADDAKAVFETSGVKVFGIARPTPEFEGKCYSALFEATEGGEKKLVVYFDMQGFSNFVGFGGIDFDITNPDGVVEKLWLPTVEHVFQLIKTLTVQSEEALSVLAAVVGAPTPGKAKQATANGRLAVTKEGWFDIAARVMMQLPSFNLKNLEFFRLMSQVYKYACENDVDPANVSFVEANSDAIYGSGVKNPPKEESLTMTDEDFIKYTNPDFEGGSLPGGNVLGLALKEAFKYIGACEGNYDKLTVTTIKLFADSRTQPMALARQGSVVVKEEPKDEDEDKDEDNGDAKRICTNGRTMSCARTMSCSRTLSHY